MSDQDILRAAELNLILQTLETLDSAGQIDLLRHAARETVGTFKTPRMGGKAHEQIARIRAYDICGRASNIGEAISNWCKSARRTALILERLDQAERILRSPGPIAATDMCTACDFILTHSTCAGARLIAKSVRDVLNRADAA